MDLSLQKKNTRICYSKVSRGQRGRGQKMNNFLPLGLDEVSQKTCEKLNGPFGMAQINTGGHRHWPSKKSGHVESNASPDSR